MQTEITPIVRRKNEDDEYPVEVAGEVIGFVYRLDYKYGATGWAALTLDGKRAVAHEYATRRDAVAALVAAQLLA